MRTKSTLSITLVVFSIFLFTSCIKNIPDLCGCKLGDVVATVTPFSKGFNNPRGLKFGPDGYLYVAEGGIGGSTKSTKCAQVIAPLGPYTGSTNGARISRVNSAGVRSTYVSNLPSSQTAATQGSLVSGVADVAFIGNTLYGILSGAGCSHGVAWIPNGVFKVKSDRTWTMIANLSSFQMSHPVAHSEHDDFEPDGTWYSMINVDGSLYAVEPNHGELDRITTAGHVNRVIDISAFEGHIVPTAMTFHEDNFYVGNLNVFPIVDGSSTIFKITPSGHISVYASGFTTVLGLVFDKAGTMYVLENTTGNAFPTPGSGDIVRVAHDGQRSVIVSNLNLPTGMTMGPDENLYVSNWGFGPPAIGGGEILKVTLTCKLKSQWDY